MSDKSKIEWTAGDDGTPGATWNPVTGCTKVSPGCDHCYAETFAERWRGIAGHHFENGFDVTLRPERLEQPLHWKRPRRIFSNSMSDLLHDSVPDDFIAQVFGVMCATPRHTYQVLTKRHARLRSLLNNYGWWTKVVYYALGYEDEPGGQRPGPTQTQPDGCALLNVWLGVSAEDQEWADIRVPALLATPAAVRFISAEPLLGPINLIGQGGNLAGAGWHALPDPPEYDGGEPVCQSHGMEHCSQGCRFVDWVIVGGESGPGARPMESAWARSIVSQCRAADVPVFVKQLGAVLGRSLGAGPKGGDWDAWPDDLRIREYPKTPAASAA